MNNFQTFRQEIQSKIENIISIPTEEIIQTRNGELGFPNLKDEIEEANNALRVTIGLSSYKIGLDERNKYISHLNSYESALTTIRNYDVRNSSEGQRNQLISALRSSINNIISVVNGLLVSESVWNINFQSFNSRAREAENMFDELRKIYTNAEDVAVKKINAIESLEQAAINATKITGLNVHSGIFESESKTHSELSHKWLISTFACLSLIIVIALIYYFNKPEKSDLLTNFDIIQFTVTKVLIFTSLFYALNFCSKFYRVHRHNSVVNKHRQNALQTFETFAKASGDDLQTKNAILLIATQAIFANQSTGYLGEEKGNENPKVLEIFKTVDNKNQN